MGDGKLYTGLDSVNFDNTFEPFVSGLDEEPYVFDLSFFYSLFYFKGYYINRSLITEISTYIESRTVNEYFWIGHIKDKISAKVELLNKEEKDEVIYNEQIKMKQKVNKFKKKLFDGEMEFKSNTPIVNIEKGLENYLLMDKVFLLNYILDFRVDENVNEDLVFLTPVYEQYIEFKCMFNYFKRLIKEPMKELNISTPSFNKLIFRSFEAESWFNDTLVDLGAIDKSNKIKKRGLGVKANAIYRNEKCKKSIIIFDLALKDFIMFLNKNYEAEFKDFTKLASPNTNIEDSVSNLIDIF